jgi:hypothetical protein
MNRYVRRAVSGLVVAALIATVLAVPAGPTAADGGASRGAGYLWLDWASPDIGVHYTPSANYQYNSRNPGAAVNTVMRLSSGRYGVRFPGLQEKGIAHVTAYGWDGAYCVVGYLARDLVSNFQEIGVDCFSAGGDPVDHQFTVSMTNVNVRPEGTAIGYLLGGGSWLGTSTPDIQFNSAGAVNTVWHGGPGNYTVRLPALDWPSGGGHVQVTPFGGPKRCNVAGWGPAGGSQIISVQCFDRYGAPADATFILTYVNRVNILGLPPHAGAGGHDSAYAWTDQPFEPWYQPFPAYQFNVTDTAATAGRSGTGTYNMHFQYADLGTGNVQVTAYGSGPQYCNVAYWNPWDGIQVRCYDHGGTPTDAHYDVAFTGPLRAG